MLIEVQNLCVGYGNKKVLKNVNLSLSKNEIVTIVGPNGSGKQPSLSQLLDQHLFRQAKC